MNETTKLVEAIADKLGVPVEHLLHTYASLWWVPVVEFAITAALAILGWAVLLRMYYNFNERGQDDDFFFPIGIIIVGVSTVIVSVLAFAAIPTVLVAIYSPEAFAIRTLLQR